MASSPSQIETASPSYVDPPFRRLLVGHDDPERLHGALALARQLVGTAGTICVCGPLDGRHERVTTANGDAVVVASAPHGPAGRICVDRGILRLLRRARLPVAVAPAGHSEHGSFHHIGIAFDASLHAQVALAVGYALAARDGAAVTLLRALPRVAEGLASERERLRYALLAQDELDAAAAAAPAGVNPQARLLHGGPGSVLTATFDGPVDLVVCGSHGYGALQRAVLGSVSQALLEGASHPVLVVRATPCH